MIDQILRKVKEKFKNYPKRLNHTLNVYHLALSIAKVHGIDEEKVAIASLWHDYAKHDDIEIIEQHCSSYIKSKYQKLPFVLHGYAAANILKKEFEIKDFAILQAISSHVIGVLNMTCVGKVLFISDFCAEDKAKSQEKDEIIKLAYESLNVAYKKALVLKSRLFKKTAQDFSLIKELIKVMEDFKVNDLAVYDFLGTNAFYDYFIICSVNPRTAKAISNYIHVNFKEFLKHVENSPGWVLIDCNDVIIHLFSKENREFYNLDQRLSNTKKIK